MFSADSYNSYYYNLNNDEPAGLSRVDDCHAAPLADGVTNRGALFSTIQLEEQDQQDCSHFQNADEFGQDMFGNAHDINSDVLYDNMTRSRLYAF